MQENARIEVCSCIHNRKMINSAREGDSKKKERVTNLEGVVGREMDVEEVHATSIRAICWSHNGRLPLEQIIAYGSCTAVRGRILLEVHQFLQHTKSEQTEPTFSNFFTS